jgi:hydroxyethylthiazole kinase
MSSISAATVARDLSRIRESRPLVHNITNFVVMEPTANALLALGASPVMAHAPEEMEAFAQFASALVLNIGTLDASWIASMRLAAEAAAARGTPTVLDPVGAGATALRTDTAAELLSLMSPRRILRGNASEVMAVAGAAIRSHGVDSSAGSDEATGSAESLARSQTLVASVSGGTDVITDGTRTVRILNDTPMMARVTGMGCTASAITGAFAGVNSDPFEAAVHAMAVMGVAGEIAAEGAAGPGSFLARFHDALAAVDGAALEARLRLG